MTKWHKESSRSKSVGLHSAQSRLAVCFALAGTIAILATVLVAGCGSEETGQEPSQEIQAMLQDRFEAMNAADTRAVARCYAANAVLDNYTDEMNLQGATTIANYFGGITEDFGMQWEVQGDPIQFDKYVIQRVTMSQVGGTGTGAGVHVLDIDANDQIAHEWIVSWVAE